MGENRTSTGLELPFEIGEYRLTRLIGEGGMGRVFEGVQLSLERPVAVKLLSAQFAGDAEFLERFRREARSAAAINHHSIIPIYDIGEEDGLNYFVMEYVAGESLNDRLNREGKLAVEPALKIVREVAEGLQAALSGRIIHRDIKPDNILCRPDGSVTIADLGIARSLAMDSDLTMTGTGLGSPKYIAPEQAATASEVDHRADIYSLGITLLQLLTGKLPFTGPSPMAIAMAHVNDPLPTGAELGTELPGKVEKLIRRMAAKDRADRIQNYAALIREVDDLLGVPRKSSSAEISFGGAQVTTVDSRPTVATERDGVCLTSKSICSPIRSYDSHWIWASGGVALIALIVWLTGKLKDAEEDGGAKAVAAPNTSAAVLSAPAPVTNHVRPVFNPRIQYDPPPPPNQPPAPDSLPGN